MRFTPLVFKIAAELIREQLEQRAEPDNQLEQSSAPVPGTSALRLLGKNNRSTATEPSPKLLSTAGSVSPSPSTGK